MRKLLKENGDREKELGLINDKLSPLKYLVELKD